MGIISTTSVCKHFGTTPAADNISLEINEGEIYGFLGLNGAGKTTLIRMLLGMIRPDAGGIRLFGEALDSGFGRWNEVGYLVETPNAYPNLSVLENLKVYYHLRQLNDPGLIGDIIDQLKLTPYRDKKTHTLSLGNRQRLGLAKALLHRPNLLILDEPINGLDPEGIVEVRNLLRELASQGATVFLSSHILGEISKVANRIGIIHQGKLVRELTIGELTEQVTRRVLVDTTDNRKAVGCLIDAGYKATLNRENDIDINDPAAVAQPEKIAALLVGAGLPPKKLYPDSEDLEMYFLRTIRNPIEP